MKSVNRVIVRRMLSIRDELIATNKLANQKEFCKAIGIHYSCFYQALDGRQCFTHSQILKAAKLAGKTIDYVYGLRDR